MSVKMFEMMRILLFAAIFFGAASAMAQLGFPTDAGVSWGTVTSGTRSAVKTFRTFVLNSQNDLESYWNNAGPEGSVPRSVNFQQDLVVAIHLGQRSSGGYTVFVEKVQRIQASNIQVTYVEQKPDPNQIVSQSLTSPFTLIRIKRVGGNITFYGTERVGPPLVGVKPGPIEGPWNNMQGIRFPLETVFAGVNSKVKSFRIEVLENAADFNAYIRSSLNGGVRMDTMDWDRYSLLVIHLGRRNSGGYEVQVDGGEKSAAGVRIHWTEYRPSPREMVTQALTSPFVIVRVPKALSYDFSGQVRYGSD